MRLWLTRQLQNVSILHQSTWRRESMNETGVSLRQGWDTVFVAAGSLILALQEVARRYVLGSMKRKKLAFIFNGSKVCGVNMHITQFSSLMILFCGWGDTLVKLMSSPNLHLMRNFWSTFLRPVAPISYSTQNAYVWVCLAVFLPFCRYTVPHFIWPSCFK
jgi:hypothetical protein